MRAEFSRPERRTTSSRARPAAIILSALFILLSAQASFQARETAAASRLARDMEFFSSFESRLPGREGNRAAADYIENRFRELGMSAVRRQEYTVVGPYEETPSSLEIEGRRVRLNPLWPNDVRTSKLPPEGLTGRLVYAGDGSLHNYRGLEVPGSIVLMDYNSGSSWLEAAMLGARAVIFIEPEKTTFYESRHKFLEVPLDMPRFYVSAREAARLVGAARENSPEVTLRCRQEWREIEAANIVGYFPGTDPEREKEIVAVSAYYDSISVVPEVAPGADQATSISTLLHLAEHFSRTPPGRPVLFIALGSHFQEMQGIVEFLNTHHRSHRHHVADMEEFIDIHLLINLELSSHSKFIATWHNSRDLNLQRALTPFSRWLVDNQPERFGNRMLNGVTPDRGMSFQSFLVEPLRTAGSIANIAGLPSLSLVTAHDNRRYFDTPLDTLEKVNLDNVSFQAEMLAEVLELALAEPGFIERKPSLNDNLRGIDARIVYFDALTSFVPSEPLENAIVTVRYETRDFYSSMQNRKSAFGVRGSRYYLTDAEGRARVSHFMADSRHHRLMAYYLCPETGRITWAPDRGSDGDRAYPMSIAAGAREWMIVLFECVSANLYDFIDPRYLNQLETLEIFDPADSIPTAYGFTYHERVPWEWTSDHEPVAVTHTDPGMLIKATGDVGVLGKRILLLNSPHARTQRAAEGEGYDLTGNPDSFLFTPYRAARDMINLNEFRINNFARFGIVNERLSNLHERAIEHFDAATRAMEERDWYSFLTESRRSVGLESRAYPDVRATTDDVIIGLIFYFVILLPFAFFFERLVFGFVNINKQIAAVFFIFVAVYIALRLVHPGFQLSNNPEIILLGFILIALAGIVIALIASKFETQMHELKQKRARIFDADVGRTATTGSAFGLGMANMKRRKVRTALTSTTLILLTFTVLSFTSIMSYMRFNQVRQPHDPSYEGMMVRDIAWAPLQESTYNYLRNELYGKAIVSPRAALINPYLEQDTFVRLGHREHEFFTRGIMGLSVKEPGISGVDQFLVAGRWFSTPDAAEIILPESIAETLGFDPEETGLGRVELFGENLLVAGIISEQAMDDFIDLDGTRLTPSNFAGLGEREIQQLRMQRRARVMTAEAVPVTKNPADNIAIVPFDFLRSRGGHIYSVAATFKPGHDTKEEVETIVSRLAMNLFAGIDGRTYVYSSLALTSFSGIGNLFVPILIASLIVLNTMLGAVYERIKEIGIYSSIGLAPSHISTLFFAEACVYAVIGAVIGYLLGQVVTKVLSELGLLGGLTLNYSSLSAVTSTMIVMATVFLSTIFPARKAAELSVPDITRKWVLPKPEGDDWQFDFPFTVGQNEVLGLMVFLRDYFESFSVEAVGDFYTHDVKFQPKDTPGGREYTVSGYVYPAPFDLGVKQLLELVAAPLEEYTFYYIKVRITRESGEAGDWQRLNRRFLDNLRKQFLVWRTIDNTTKEQYRKEGEEIHG